jgi:hypothetical protein
MQLEAEDGTVTELYNGQRVTLEHMPKSTTPEARWYYDEKGLVGSLAEGSCLAWVRVKNPK